MSARPGTQTTTTRPCAYPDCGKPLVRRKKESLAHYLARETCGQSCGQRLGQWRVKQNGGPLGKERDRLRENDHSAAYWPKVTGEIDWANAFAKHNLNIKPGPFVNVPRPLNHSPTGNSASLLMDAAQ